MLPADETGADWMTDGDEPLLRRHLRLQANYAHPIQTVDRHRNAAPPRQAIRLNYIHLCSPLLTSIYQIPTHPHSHQFLPLLPFHPPNPLIPSSHFTTSFCPLHQSSDSPTFTFAALHLHNTKQPIYFTSIPAITTNQEEHVCNFQLARDGVRGVDADDGNRPVTILPRHRCDQRRQP